LFKPCKKLNHSGRYLVWELGCPPCLPNSQRGIALLEVVMALGVFSVVGIAVLVGTSMIHRSGSLTEEQSVAENVARNQMEHIFSSVYQSPPTTYPAVEVPVGFTVSAVAQEFVQGDLNIEKITVSITHDNRSVLTLETLRTNN